jgi:uncharacterized membrane-anchored protein
MFIKKYLSEKTLRKVPEITLYFWIVKFLSTALGESTSDFLVRHINPFIAVFLGAIGFAIAIVLQFLARKYVAWVYWLAITMVAIFGTMVADVIHIVLGVPYYASALFFTFVLVIIFIFWYRTEKTLSIHSINTHQREVFYWIAVITTFALGTAVGDMTAITFHLGYLVSGILFLALFSLPFIARWKLKLNEVTAFWLAYIVTRPLGASFADWFGRTPNLGGIGLGTGRTSLVLAGLIIGFVVFFTITQKDVKA